MSLDRPLEHEEWQNLKGRCISCGFLCQRTDLLTKRLYEATIEARSHGNLASHPDSDRKTFPWCFVCKEPLYEEFKGLTTKYGKAKDNAEISWEIITKDLKCPKWYKYTPFLSSREHFQKMNMESIQRFNRNMTIIMSVLVSATLAIGIANIVIAFNLSN